MDAILAIRNQLARLDGHSYRYRLVMRPSLFNGKFCKGDIVKIDYQSMEYDWFEILSHDPEINILSARPSYNQTAICTFNVEHVVAVNGVGCNLKIPKPVSVIPETYNPEPIDGDKALDILRGMLS